MLMERSLERHGANICADHKPHRAGDKNSDYAVPFPTKRRSGIKPQLACCRWAAKPSTARISHRSVMVLFASYLLRPELALAQVQSPHLCFWIAAELSIRCVETSVV